VSAPMCDQHPSPIRHTPVLCRTEHVWHHVVCAPRPKFEKVVVLTLHLGRLDKEARERRAIKNARNRARSGEATRPRGTQRRGR
jgi:hypothetical protein